MATKQTIAVVGATGAQGGGLARAILNDPESRFQVRALTRKPRSEHALELAERGAEIVQADLDNLQSLKEAFRGADLAFCMTNFWEHFSPEREMSQAENMAEAAREAGLKHVVWSTFEDTRLWIPLDDDRMPTLQGTYKVPHFDAKAQANVYFIDAGVPVTLLLTSFYWENFIYFGLEPRRGPDGILAITMCMGDRKLPGIASEDIGKCVYGIFKRGDEYVDKAIGISGDQLAGAEMAAALTEALGEEVRYNDLPFDVYRGLGYPGADEMGNMFQFKHDFNDYYCGVRDPAVARELNPELLDFRHWLALNAERIPVSRVHA